MPENELFNINNENDANVSALNDIIETIMQMPDDAIQGTTLESMRGMFAGAFTPAVVQQSKNSILELFKANNYSKTNAQAAVNQIKTQINDLIDSLNPSEGKRLLLRSLFEQMISMYDNALAEYCSAAISMKIKLDEGATAPSYAHESDAAADLYAATTITLQPHSLSNMIPTGVHIELPEGWMAMVFPRSSMGAKTGLRLSNSAGIIDNLYRGAIGVIYDNLSDEPYTINQGDRIAQLMVMPSYQFNPQIVETLSETERGDGGFGSSGK